MPKIKREEKDMDLQTSGVQKETFVTRWFKDNCVNNQSEVKIVCDLVSRSASSQFFMNLKSGNTEVYAIIFYATFMTTLEFIKTKQREYNNFTITIAQSVNLGYTNNDDDSNEKVGNFMPIMEYVGINRNIIPDQNIEVEQTATNFILWKELNTKKNIEYYKEIQERAFNKLKDEFGTNIRHSEGIIPLFCIFLDHIVQVLKVKFKEAEGTDVSEVSINVLGLFDVFYSFNEEDNKEIIEFQPNITMKLALKNDSTAGRD